MASDKSLEFPQQQSIDLSLKSCEPSSAMPMFPTTLPRSGGQTYRQSILTNGELCADNLALSTGHHHQQQYHQQQQQQYQYQQQQQQYQYQQQQQQQHRHLKPSRPAKLYKCPSCNAAYTAKTNMIRHKRRSPACCQSMKCQWCERPYLQVRSLIEHQMLCRTLSCGQRLIKISANQPAQPSATLSGHTNTNNNNQKFTSVASSANTLGCSGNINLLLAADIRNRPGAMHLHSATNNANNQP